MLLTLAITGCQKKDHIFTGYVEGRLSFVSATFSGSLEKLFVKRGDSIVAKQNLFVLEQKAEKAIVKETKAEIDALMAEKKQAEVNLQYNARLLERREKLARSRVISDEELDISRNAKQNALEKLNSINSKLRAAQAKLENVSWIQGEKNVTAEKSGIVFDTYFTMSEFVPAGKPVLSILTAKNIYIVFYVPESTLHKIHKQQELMITCDGVKKPFPAKISLIYPKAEFTPPVLYTDSSRSSLLYKIEADTDSRANPACLHLGQPVNVALPK